MHGSKQADSKMALLNTDVYKQTNDKERVWFGTCRIPYRADMDFHPDLVCNSRGFQCLCWTANVLEFAILTALEWSGVGGHESIYTMSALQTLLCGANRPCYRGTQCHGVAAIEALIVMVWLL